MPNLTEDQALRFSRLRIEGVKVGSVDGGWGWLEPDPGFWRSPVFDDLDECLDDAEAFVGIRTAPAPSRA